MSNTATIVNINQGSRKMPSERGFVNLWRDIDKQPWYKDSECKAVFMHILIKATHKPCKVTFKGIDMQLNQGQLYVTLTDLENKLSIDRAKIDRSLTKFKKLGQISTNSIKKSNRNIGQIITILGWEKWQKSETPTETPNNTPDRPNLKAVEGGCETPSETPTETLNNNVLNNSKKTMLVSDEKSTQISHLEIREKAFEHFWKKWSECKKLLGKTNTAPKATTKAKFLTMMNDKHVNKIGIDGFRTEISLMCELATGAHTDIADDKNSSFRAYENMYPAKFLTNKQWRECDEYRGLVK